MRSFSGWRGGLLVDVMVVNGEMAVGLYIDRL